LLHELYLRRKSVVKLKNGGQKKKNTGVFIRREEGGFTLTKVYSGIVGLAPSPLQPTACGQGNHPQPDQPCKAVEGLLRGYPGHFAQPPIFMSE
jgi:hypothetical protein